MSRRALTVRWIIVAVAVAGLVVAVPLAVGFSRSHVPDTRGPATQKAAATADGTSSTRSPGGPARGIGAAPPAPIGTAPAGTARPGSGRIRFDVIYSGRATPYAADGPSVCSFAKGTEVMVAAVNASDYQGSLACGAYLKVRGPSKTVTVIVVDRCVSCTAGSLDLSREAFALIAPRSASQVPITWTLVSPNLSGPITYRYAEGSTARSCAVQIRNHRSPIRSVEALVADAWIPFVRGDDNYFVAPGGRGCGADLRVTDIAFGRVSSAGPVTVRVDVDQQGPAQLPVPAP